RGRARDDHDRSAGHGVDAVPTIGRRRAELGGSRHRRAGPTCGAAPSTSRPRPARCCAAGRSEGARRIRPYTLAGCIARSTPQPPRPSSRPAAPHRVPGPVRRARRLVPVALALAATLAYGLLGSQQFHQLVARSWDLGIFTQLARAYGELRAPIVPIKGDEVNLLGDHFHPLLALLAPVWWV